METFGFGLLAACTLASAILVVTTKNLVHAALWLGVTLLATAALYAMLGASFLAGVQVLLYVGGVITLMIFGVMITRKHDGIVVEAESQRRVPALVASGALFGVVAAAVRATKGLDAVVEQAPSGAPADIGRAVLGPHVLAFEVVSALLLAAIVGAVVVARRKDPSLAGRADAPERAPAAQKEALP